MVAIVIPLIILGLVVSLVYAAFPATRKWGVSVLCFISAGVSFLAASGVLAEHLWGPRWSWNFAHHGPGYAEGALVQGVCWLLFGLYCRSSRQRTSATFSQIPRR